MTVHNGAYLFFRLFSFQSSFFLWTTLSLFLLFFFAFIFTSLIAHICFSVIENECSALRFLLFKQGTLFAATVQASLDFPPDNSCSDFTAQVGVLSTVDFSHASLAYLLQNFVMRKCRADHWAPPRAMQLVSMLRREAAKDNGKALCPDGTT